MRSEVVIRLRPGSETDRYGNAVEDWSNPAQLPISTLAPPEPRPSGSSGSLSGGPVGEPVLDARNAVTSGWTLYLPPDADVTAQDRMTVRGITYDVLGQPADWSPRGIVVQLSTVAG